LAVVPRSYYVVAAWIWAIIWYLGLDPIKWVLAWIFNEDGFRNKTAFLAEQDK
jgi:H+-transporting ATPase